MEPFTLPVRVEQFIAMIKSKPAIWKSDKNKFKRQDSWMQVMNELYPDLDLNSCDDSGDREKLIRKVVKKWTQIRDSYVKSERKRHRLSESELERYRPYLFSEYLTFLNPVLNSIRKPKKTQKSDTTDSEDENCAVDPKDTYDENAPTTVKIEYVEREPIEHVSVSRKRRYSSDDNVEFRVTDPSTSTSMSDSAVTHLSFFKGIIPSLENFDVDQVLEFQLGVLNLVKQIRNKQM